MTKARGGRALLALVVLGAAGAGVAYALRSSDLEVGAYEPLALEPAGATIAAPRIANPPNRPSTPSRERTPASRDLDPYNPSSPYFQQVIV
jgi:hypothetical protein